MAAWMEHAECQLQAVDQVLFAVLLADAGYALQQGLMTPHRGVCYLTNLGG